MDFPSFCKVLPEMKQQGPADRLGAMEPVVPPSMFEHPVFDMMEAAPPARK